MRLCRSFACNYVFLCQISCLRFRWELYRLLSYLPWLYDSSCARLQVPPVPSTSSGPSTEAADESTVVQQLRRRIAEIEKNLSIIYAGAAVVKSKSELALQFEKFAREELVKATNSLSCKYPITFVFRFFALI